MKKMNLLSKISLIAIISMMMVWQSCQDDFISKKVTVTLSYKDGAPVQQGVAIKVVELATGTEFEQQTDANGSATFDLIVGTYEFAASDVRANNGKYTAYNGRMNDFIGEDWEESEVVKLVMSGSQKSQLIIKEIYFGGCPAPNKPRGYYSYGEYITLYNNSMTDVNLKNLCFGSMGSNSFFMKRDIKEGDTEPYWFKEDWTPATAGYFYFPNETILKPGKQVTVAASGGIDHTATYPNSVDLSSADNYVMYDVEVYDHKLTYPAPSANIPASHYLKAVKCGGTVTAWWVSKSSPAIFLFYPQGQDPKTYGMSEPYDYWMNKKIFPRKKVPSEWVVDAIDVFAAGKDDKNVKRLNPKIDSRYIYLVSKKGYTLYRNVDKKLTEAIPMNKGKLVYNYSDGTKDVEPKYGTSDPSGIDAEASMAKGAIIVFKDTNNSKKDFHMRKKSSLRK